MEDGGGGFDVDAADDEARRQRSRQRFFRREEGSIRFAQETADRCQQLTDDMVRRWCGGICVCMCGASARSGAAGPNQMVCCQGTVFRAHEGSNGLRCLSTPWAIINSLRMHAPTAAIFAFPAATKRSNSALSSGLKRMPVSAGSYSAWRRRALPALDTEYDDERELTRYV